MKRYCLTLDLKDDPELIKQYEEQHKAVWPQIIDSIKQSGILNMEIYRLFNRLFMIMETKDDFTFGHKQRLDQDNQKVQEWEDLMWKYQQPIKGSAPGEKWILMENIFNLS